MPAISGNAWNYEQLVEQIYERLLASDDAVTVHRRRRFEGKRSGQSYEIDVSFEFKKVAVSFLVLVECKFYSRKVEVGDTIEFAFKVEDIGAQKGILVSTIGFQRGVFNIARSSGLALVKVNQPDTFDVVLSSRGPKVDFDYAFDEYYDVDVSGGEMPLLGIAESHGRPPEFLASLHIASGRDVAFGPWTTLFDALYDAGEQDKRSTHLLAAARRERASRNFSKAAQLAEEALALRERLLGAEHLGVAEVLNLLSGLYEKSGRLSEGESVARRAIDIGKKHLHPSHPDLLISQNNLATIYMGLGRDADAEECLVDARDAIDAGTEGALLAAINCNLAKICGRTDRHAEAASLYETALGGIESSLGASPMLAEVLDGYSLFLRGVGKPEEAEALAQRARNIRNKETDSH